jgi:hypothetical protein
MGNSGSNNNNGGFGVGQVPGRGEFGVNYTQPVGRNTSVTAGAAPPVPGFQNAAAGVGFSVKF